MPSLLARLHQRDLNAEIPWPIQLCDQTHGALAILRLFAARLPGPLRNCIIAPVAPLQFLPSQFRGKLPQ